MSYRIPFNRPYAPEGVGEHVARSLASGHMSGSGPATQACEAVLEEMLGSPRVLFTTSCTHALEMAALLLDVGPGDEVIVPSFTFVSTANAFALRGARPVFVDIRADTCNIDETLVEAAITPRTKAIVPVHYAGVGCEMDTLLDVAQRHGLAVVEDNAHGLLGRYKGRALGTFGALAAHSFHETKNFSCGEGGALAINDAALLARAEIIRDKGTDRGRFSRGEVDKYTWVDLGSSYVASDVLAAVLLASLEARELIQTRRAAIWHRYASELADWAGTHDVGLPAPPPYCEHPSHLFHVLLPDAAGRDALIAHLAERGIIAVFHYVPLHVSPMGRRVGHTPAPCEVAESVAARLVRLPMYTGMTESEQAEVIDAVRVFSLA